MKHWEEGRIRLFGDFGISLIDGEDNMVVSLSIYEGKVCIQECCDNYFSVTLEKEQAIEALQEAINWIKESK